MDHAAPGLSNQCRAFRVDMHGDRFLGDRRQDSAAATELRLQQRLMPTNAHLQAQAAAAGTAAIAEFLQENLPLEAAVLAQLRRTRRRVRTASLAVGARLLGGRPVSGAALMFAGAENCERGDGGRHLSHPGWSATGRPVLSRC
ncbi:hypothetical protein GGI13_006987 [Coemansia sp. RSA 455]|nr:hypothetical protein GGI13_006987 [Coemansia sp. RSA 455]